MTYIDYVSMTMCGHVYMTCINIDGMADRDDETRTTLRVSKKLIKDMKRYALEKETTLTSIVNEAFKEYLQKRK